MCSSCGGELTIKVFSVLKIDRFLKGTERNTGKC